MTYDFRSDLILGPALAYWIRKRGPRAMPCKRDINPTEMPPKLLRNLQIIDVIDAGARFRYRLVGTASVEAHGRDYTGKYPEDLLDGDRLKFLLRIYRTVYETKSPVFSRNGYYTARGNTLFANRIYMPLSDDGINVHHILGVLMFESGIAINGGLWAESQLDPFAQYIEPIEIAAAVTP